MPESETDRSHLLRPAPRPVMPDPEVTTPTGEPRIPDRASPKGRRRLPRPLLEKVPRRLATASVLYAAAYVIEQAVATALDRVPQAAAVNNGAFTFALVISLGAFLVARSSRIAVETKVNLALVYMVLGAFGICVDDFWVSDPSPAGIAEITWLSVWIVAFPLFVPSPPRRLLLAALLAASCAPLSMWAAVSIGGKPLPPAGVALPLFVANFLCVVLAFTGSRLIYDLGQDVSRAQLLGSYRLDERLGSGGMGEVWRARHSLLAFPAAVKMIRPEALAESSEAKDAVLKRFLREAKATAELHSPHSIRLFDFGVAESGTLYYVMELLHGLDLRTLIDRFGPVPPERAVFILKQVCHSLADAHAQGLIHRDIKPANVYLCRLGQDFDFVKVLDFGLVVRNREDTQVSQITRPNATPGTPGYMSPELILGDRPVDARADLYSVGCLAFWLLTGTHVFNGASIMDVLIQHARTQPPRLSERCRDPLPPGLEDTVVKCLQKAPEDRPSDAADLLHALAAVPLGDGWTPERARHWWEEHGLV